MNGQADTEWHHPRRCAVERHQAFADCDLSAAATIRLRRVIEISIPRSRSQVATLCMTRRRAACARRASRVGQLAWLQRVNRPRARASLIWFTQLQGQRSKCAHEYARTQSVPINSLSCTRPPFFCPVFLARCWNQF